jgi:hypothetical protein
MLDHVEHGPDIACPVVDDCDHVLNSIRLSSTNNTARRIAITFNSNLLRFMIKTSRVTSFFGVKKPLDHVVGRNDVTDLFFAKSLSVARAIPIEISNN